MKALVTGGAGYLGSVLVERLLSEHFTVTVLDNFMYRQNSLSHLCSHKGLEIVCGDVRDMLLLKRLVAGADVIYPLAAIVGAPACDRNADLAESVNLLSIRGLKRLLSKTEQQVVVFPNTNSGYGRGSAGECDEDSPLLPVSHYGKTKVLAEQEILNEFSLGVSLRFATLFGASPRMRLDLMVNDFVYRAGRDGALVLFEEHYRRNFLHVRDAANALLFAFERVWNLQGRPWNVGDSRANMSKLELAKKVSDAFGRIVILIAQHSKDPDQRDYVVSNKRMEDLGWMPRYSLEQGIKELIKCYQQPFEGHRNG